MRVVGAYIVFNIGLLLAFLWSGPRAYESAVVAGFLSESRRESAQVTQKAHSYTRTFRGLEHQYLISWSAADIRWEGPHRISVDRSLWEATRVGDPMTLLFVGSRSTPVWKESVKEPAKRALLHGSLLAAEIGAIAWAGLSLGAMARERRRLQRLKARPKN